jgi:hypothetical protein
VSRGGRITRKQQAGIVMVRGWHQVHAVGDLTTIGQTQPILCTVKSPTGRRSGFTCELNGAVERVIERQHLTAI